MPRKNDRAQISVTVTSETKDAVARASEKLGLSKADAYRLALRLLVKHAGETPPDEIPKRGTYPRNE